MVGNMHVYTHNCKITKSNTIKYQLFLKVRTFKIYPDILKGYNFKVYFKSQNFIDADRIHCSNTKSQSILKYLNILL